MVYPTISNSIVKIITSDVVLKFEVYNLQGSVIKSENYKKQVDVSNMNSGVYLLKVETPNGSSIHRIIKQ